MKDGGGLFEGSDVGSGGDLGSGEETCPTHFDREKGLGARGIVKGTAEED